MGQTASHIVGIVISKIIVPIVVPVLLVCGFGSSGPMAGQHCRNNPSDDWGRCGRKFIRDCSERCSDQGKPGGDHRGKSCNSGTGLVDASTAASKKK
ncbi:hypothetical protein DFH94DRAFT_329509 [Russula ochroleuca]|uniref:Uncharacterized protein n=1 Tax=Russula ochroleuca TaxID=152965 RepID=A0A9P5TCA4_9AGAM|nr:hypothetical protein DFH94DRAFT_329509 [Russula ochroleuca]